MTFNPCFRPGRSSDAPILSRIAQAAKASWGYSAETLERWLPELTVSAAFVEVHRTLVMEAPLRERTLFRDAAGGDSSPDRGGFLVGGASLLGFSVLVPTDEADVIELDHFWIVPERQRSGLGRLLFEKTLDSARASGASRLRVVADPHAEGFYERMGCHRIAEIPAFVEGVEDRVLPVLERPL